MAAPAVPHSLLWLQMMLHSSHPFQVVLNSLLTKAIGEHGMDNSTREQSSMNTMVLTWGRRTGRTGRTSSPNRIDLKMLTQNSLLTKAIGEHGMDSSTHEQSSMNIMVVT